MKVIVCIKQINYIYHLLPFDTSNSAINPEKMIFMLNLYDEIAMEAAIRIKENFDDCEIITITAGPAMCEAALRYAFAMGANKMIRIETDCIDPWSISVTLAEYIKKIKYDIILCGKKSLDYNSGQVGSFLAEILDLPQVSGIVKLELGPDKKTAIADRYLGKGDRQRVKCILPALFTVEEGMNNPRYPKLEKRLLAEKEKIEVIKLATKDNYVHELTQIWQSMNLSPPYPKPKKIFTPDSKLLARERMKLIMTGGISKKTGRVLSGDPNEMAQEIVRFLEEKKFL